MTRRVLVSPRLPELRSGNAELDRWVSEHLQRHIAEVFEQISYLTPESGTWTPVVRGSGTAGTYELATAEGFYYKFADYVVVNVGIVFAGAITAGGTGNFNITGVPFKKPTRAEGSYFPMGSLFMDGIDATAGAVNLALCFTGDDSSTLQIEQTIDNAADVVVPVSAVAANDRIFGTIVYEAGDRSG